MVESVGGQVGPHRSVVLAVHLAGGEPFEHLLLAFEVGLALVVDLVEAHSHAAVGLVESVVDPAVHRLPEGAHLGIPGFPFAQHGAGLLHQGRCGFGLLLGHAFLHEVGHFGLEMLVEEHVEVADEMVALLAGLLGGDTVAPLLPGEHRLADVYAAVVDDVGLHHAVAARGEYLREAPSEQYVAEVAQVEGPVGVGRGVLHHDERTVGRGLADAVVGLRGYVLKHRRPEGRLYDDVEKSLDDIEAVDRRLVVDKPLAYLGACLLRALACGLDKREHHYCQIAFEFLACRRRRDRSGIRVDAVELLDCLGHSLGDDAVD